MDTEHTVPSLGSMTCLGERRHLQRVS